MLRKSGKHFRTANTKTSAASRSGQKSGNFGRLCSECQKIVNANRSNLVGDSIMVKSHSAKNLRAWEGTTTEGTETGTLIRNEGCCNNKVCWWEPPLECLPLDFCNNTSLHGLKYISQSKRHLSERYKIFFNCCVA